MLKHFRTKSSHTYRKCDWLAVKSSVWLNNAVFGKEIAVGLKLNQEKNAFHVSRPVFNWVVWVPIHDLVETSTSNCLVIYRRAFGVAALVLAVYENEIQAILFLVSVR